MEKLLFDRIQQPFIGITTCGLLWVYTNFSAGLLASESIFDSISLKLGKDFSDVIYVLILESRDVVGTFTRPVSIIKYSLKVSDGLPNGDMKFTILLRIPSCTSLNSIFPNLKDIVF